MTKTTFTREEIQQYAQLSPFELKNIFIDLAEQAQADKPGQKEKSSRQMLNAGRGNPNWIATGPREAYYALGYFALEESRRVWTADNLGGMPEKHGAYERFDAFVRRHPDLPGIELLAQCVQHGIQRFGFDKDEWVHELTDGITGDNYPVPDRMLTHGEQVVRGYLADEMFDKKAPADNNLSLFATEGGTAAMCYIFDSLMKNGLLKKGDKIALMVPVFTPYIEIAELDTYEFDVTYISASKFAETGVREWRYPEEEVAKLEDPEIKLVCLVNPSNPPSLALSTRVANQIKEIVAAKNPNLLLVTDDVYGTFVEGFRSIAADLPRNTLLVYSYSKHYGCTGWRLGVIGLHDDNIIDERIAQLPQEEKDRLNKRYGSLTLEPEKIRFIDRLVADSRQVALNHTAGLSLPQQVMMTLFSLFDMLEEGQAYKEKIRSIVHQRLDLLLEGAQMKIHEDPHRAAYYIELDLLAEAERVHGKEFADYLEKNYEPVDALFRLAQQTGVVLLNGGGFEGPTWSVRVSLANLDNLDYLKIGHHLRGIFNDYAEEWRTAKA
ncbi:bifunctional aspartate transaminase/aspartate 4-decarboxylase [Streptomyces sp. NBC_00006]|uniref:bifunctional aspartate transaminase/aspartate 4-decarboxylase n=1 Tax=unclassified Streptomyces TaxID=2593676 RepID=UPI00225BD3EE|nr:MULTISPECIES: bifunctional aspartate transaminase/aspartate 4-decarboxylase [unclassified Streptomyces]MCX5533370.1 bifunctional aspartate transaminase/aspartate 4-decarboxylase [Streptomyces sp. NBC_00006]